MNNIIITGSNGFLAQHLMTHLRSQGHDPYGVTRPAYDLRNTEHIRALFRHTGKPDIIFHLAAHVGGIQYNIDHPGELFYDNVIMNTNLIHEAALAGCGKFIMVGSVCSYPAHNPIPIREHRLWEGYPEASNGAYGVAKLMAYEQLKAYHQQYRLKFSYPVLSNLYGPGDNFGEQAHVIPALIKRFAVNPETITVWGDGSPTRDFLYVEDAARALVACVDVDYQEPLNVANGIETSIRTVVETLAKITNYQGQIVYDTDKPNGQLRRAYDIFLAKGMLKWQPIVKFKEGLKKTVSWYTESQN